MQVALGACVRACTQTQQALHSDAGYAYAQSACGRHRSTTVTSPIPEILLPFSCAECLLPARLFLHPIFELRARASLRPVTMPGNSLRQTHGMTPVYPFPII